MVCLIHFVHGTKIMKHDSLVPNKNSFWWQYNHYYHVPIIDTFFLTIGLLPVQQMLAPLSTDWTAAERPTDWPQPMEQNFGIAKLWNKATYCWYAELVKYMQVYSDLDHKMEAMWKKTVVNTIKPFSVLSEYDKNQNIGSSQSARVPTWNPKHIILKFFQVIVLEKLWSVQKDPKF